MLRSLVGSEMCIRDRLMMQEYVHDLELSFAAIGDATDNDAAPIQICDFAKGADLDEWLKRLWLEEGGGGSGRESYELTAFYYAHHCSLDCLDKDGKKGIFFITGDEGYYPEVVQSQVNNHVGDPIECNLPSAQIFERLQSKFEVFFCFPRKSMEEKIANIDREIDKRLAREGGCAQGAIVCTLTWETNCDLDLHCLTPDGGHISYQNMRAGGGTLDVDMTSRPSADRAPVENIFFPGPALGKYKFWVHGYRCPENTAFNCRVKIHDETHMFSSTVNNKGETQVMEFEYKGEVYHSSEEKKVEAEQKLKDKYAAYDDEVILEQWGRVLSRERILDVGDPKAIVDIMLGAVAILNEKRDLDGYVEDLKTRGQDEIRIHHCIRALAELEAAKTGGFMDGNNADSEEAAMAFELAEVKKEIAAMKAAELTALLPPPTMEQILEEDLVRVASQPAPAPAPAPAVYYSS
eukprot:TRINITY_DN1383_c0_g2_i1.p1 TRINITY_DN1383_c0_g2~~TRINITY_DN1383_c0_g2_i1.p1  ORF type:complete len:464 (+),score=155.45 TRINITY_DN1383_c0_g2_i1:149-1540(+)